MSTLIQPSTNNPTSNSKRVFEVPQKHILRSLARELRKGFHMLSYRFDPKLEEPSIQYDDSALKLVLSFKDRRTKEKYLTEMKDTPTLVYQTSIGPQTAIGAGYISPKQQDDIKSYLELSSQTSNTLTYQLKEFQAPTANTRGQSELLARAES